MFANTGFCQEPEIIVENLSGTTETEIPAAPSTQTPPEHSIQEPLQPALATQETTVHTAGEPSRNFISELWNKISEQSLIMLKNIFNNWFSKLTLSITFAALLSFLMAFKSTNEFDENFSPEDLKKNFWINLFTCFIFIFAASQIYFDYKWDFYKIDYALFIWLILCLFMNWVLKV